MRLIAAIVLGMTMALGATAAVAQDKYPSRPVKFVQGFPAGGNADAITRVLGAVRSCVTSHDYPPYMFKTRP